METSSKISTETPAKKAPSKTFTHPFKNNYLFWTGFLLLLAGLTFANYTLLWPELKSIEQQLTGISGNIEAIKQAPEPSASEPHEDAEPSHPAAAAPSPKLPRLIAASQLYEEVLHGSPYAQAFGVLEQSHNDKIAEMLTAIKPYALSGIKTIPALQQDFKTIQQTLQKNTETQDSDKFSHYFSSLIRIRKIDNSSADDTSTNGLLAQAATALSVSDIDSAVSVLNRLSDPAIKKQFEPWLENAQHSQEVTSHATELYHEVINESQDNSQ